VPLVMSVCDWGSERVPARCRSSRVTRLRWSSYSTEAVAARRVLAEGLRERERRRDARSRR
jgi:hypothetical protein